MEDNASDFSQSPQRREEVEDFIVAVLLEDELLSVEGIVDVSCCEFVFVIELEFVVWPVVVMGEEVDLEPVCVASPEVPPTIPVVAVFATVFPEVPPTIPVVAVFAVFPEELPAGSPRYQEGYWQREAASTFLQSMKLPYKGVQ